MNDYANYFKNNLSKVKLNEFLAFIINKNQFMESNFVCTMCPGNVKFVNYFYNEINDILSMVQTKYTN